MVSDVMMLLQQFLASHPNYKDVPLYLMGESYGGKMIVSVAAALVSDQQLDVPLLHFDFRFGLLIKRPAIIVHALCVSFVGQSMYFCDKNIVLQGV